MCLAPICISRRQSRTATRITIEALLDARAPHLRGPRPLALRDQLGALAGQPLEPAHLPEEGVRTLVLFGLGPLGGLGLGLVVAEDVPGLDLPVTEPLGQRDHVLVRQIEGEDGLAHLALAGLDLLGDRDLLLAREQRDAAHLLEVHADGIGRLAGRALGLLRFGLLLGPLRLGGLLGLLGEARLLDRVDLDVHVAEHRDDLVDLLRRGPVGRLVAVARFGRRAHRRHALRTRPHLDGALLVLNSLFWPLHASGSSAGNAADLGGPISTQRPMVPCAGGIRIRTVPCDGVRPSESVGLGRAH